MHSELVITSTWRFTDDLTVVFRSRDEVNTTTYWRHYSHIPEVNMTFHWWYNCRISKSRWRQHNVLLRHNCRNPKSRLSQHDVLQRLYFSSLFRAAVSKVKICQMIADLRRGDGTWKKKEERLYSKVEWRQYPAKKVTYFKRHEDVALIRTGDVIGQSHFPLLFYENFDVKMTSSTMTDNVSHWITSIWRLIDVMTFVFRNGVGVSTTKVRLKQSQILPVVLFWRHYDVDNLEK